MNVRIDDTCIACGVCTDLCPDVFVMGDEIAEVVANPIPPQFEDEAQEAAGKTLARRIPMNIGTYEAVMSDEKAS